MSRDFRQAGISDMAMHEPWDFEGLKFINKLFDKQQACMEINVLPLKCSTFDHTIRTLSTFDITGNKWETYPVTEAHKQIIYCRADICVTVYECEWGVVSVHTKKSGNETSGPLQIDGIGHTLQSISSLQLCSYLWLAARVKTCRDMVVSIVNICFRTAIEL